MIFISRLALYGCCVFILMACQQPPKSYAYLMSHPDVLKQEATYCEAQNANAEHCAIVQRAKQDFADLYQQWRQNPEDFGKTILQLQMANVNLSAITSDTFSEPLNQPEVTAAYLAVVGMNPIE